MHCDQPATVHFKWKNVMNKHANINHTVAKSCACLTPKLTEPAPERLCFKAEQSVSTSDSIQFLTYTFTFCNMFT